MKSNVRTTLLFVVLFVLAVTSLFAAPPVFTTDNITVTPASGSTLTIGSTITITVVDVNNITNPSLQFASATVDLTQFGGPADQAMTRVSNAPGQGQWRTSYAVQLGTIDGVANRKFTVTAVNPDGSTSVEGTQSYTVDNVPSMNNTDFTGSLYLRINSSNSNELMKVGDTVHLIASFRNYIDRVWVNWGATFAGAPEIEYPVTNGNVSISYTPASGSLPSSYVSDLSVTISKMQSISNGAAGPYLSLPAWNRVVSKNAAGQPIAADLNPPSMIGAWDLYYQSNLPLRFSPGTVALDGFTTTPSTFDIYLKLPGWSTLGGPTEFTLRFTSENREVFEKTYSLLDSPATVTHLGSGELMVTWDGRNNSGQIVGPNALTTMGITLIDVKDYVGNPALLTQIVGDGLPFNGEFPAYGDMSNPANHRLIYGGGLAHVGTTVAHRIHVVVDRMAPTFATQPEFSAESDLLGSPVRSLSIVRLINDVNNNNTWDPGEVVYYNYSNGNPASGNFDTRLQTQRNYTADHNQLRYETQKYWYVVQRVGGDPLDKWFWNGASWLPMSGFVQGTNPLVVPFPVNAAVSEMVSVPWNLGNLPSTIFTGTTAGTTYTASVYVQDNAGNITKAAQDLSINISHVYMNIPLVQTIDVVSQHVTGPGGLPVLNAGVKNFYLTSQYGDDDPGYSGPFSGVYYNTQDQITFEVEVNNRNFLRATNSVEFRYQLLGIPTPVTRYIQRSEFGANNKATITIPANIIPIGAGTVAPGTLWGVGGADNPANYIQVVSHAIQYTVNGVPFNQSFDAIGADAFYLVIPPAPVYPDPDWNVYQLAASEQVFSPGNPLYTYDAVTNPANDDVKDTTDLSFTIPTGDNLNWRLEVSKDATLIRQWNGALGVGATPFTPAPYTFNGLSSALVPAVGALATEPLTVSLYIEPVPMADPGYVAPPAGIYPNIDIVVDNTNPKLVSGTGTSIVENTRVINLDGPTRVVTELQNTLDFTLYTSEPLTDNFGVAGAWQVKLVDEFNNPIMNGLVPVTATVTDVLASGDNKTFNLQVAVNGLAGTVTHENAILIVQLPWDSASNPGRYNTPSYPYNADVWHRDSAEYYLAFNILDGKPRIDTITFQHRGVTGLAGNVGGNWNPAVDKGFVGPTVTGQQNYTLTATVYGGAYRSMATTWTADLRPLLGTAAANAAVVPTSTTTGGSPNEAQVWTLTWTGTIPTAMSNAWTHNSTLDIPITIITQDTDSPYPIAHQEVKNIVLTVDKQIPTGSNSTVTIVADGTAKAMNFTVADGTGSGINWTTEALTLNPNTGMTVTKVNNAQWTITIPTNSAVKHFSATYTVNDMMGNVFTLTRYINVDPVPHLTNVRINNDASHFVPGTNLTVTWDIENSQRATGGQLVLTSSIAVTGGSVNLTAAQLAAGTYTFNNFYNNNTALDNRTLTATVTGWTTGYTSPTASTTANRNFTYGATTATDNVDVITVDSKPVITAVNFKQGTQVINHLVPNMSGLTIEATVTSINDLNALPTIAMVTPSGTITGTFAWTGNPVITAVGNTKTITWNGVSFTNLGWTPVSDIKVARFNVNTQTIYGYAATQYMHDMVVMKDPVAVVQGKTGRAPYAGTDPDGWFAPEHFLHTEYTFVTPVNENTYPPIVADFDLIEDNITDNWRQAQAIGSGSTKNTLAQSLVRGTLTTNTINVNTYKYMAKWVISPDVQSVWNAYDDGEAIDIFFDYTQVTGQVSDTWDIKVDKKVPTYDNQLWIATGTTPPASYQPLMNGFPGPSPEISVALNPNGTWPANQKIYLKYVAMDGVGAGVLDIANPANPTGWTVAQVSHTVNPDGTAEKIISLTPNVPGNLNGNSTMTLTLGTVQDAVGHLNYGGPVNSTDPNWVATPPVLNFNFRSDYATTHQMIRGFKYLGGDRQDWATSPYVQAGAPIGMMLELSPVVPDNSRGTDVESIEVSSVQLNTKTITNVTGGTDNWVTLEKDPVTGLYYLNANYNVNTNFAHGAGISMQYRINYLITYTDGSTSVPPAFVSPVIPNVVYVDKELPQFIFANNDPTNPNNQRSIFYWSESIGSAQEGYVVPGDTNGQLRLIFKDDNQYAYANPTTAPSVVISNLNQFVAGMPLNYTVQASELSYHNSYSLTINNNLYSYNNVWVAALDNMAIFAQNPPIFSSTINYAITDVVGNGPITGNRMVEIAANGPIVPIIREARLLTTVPGSGTPVYNYLAQNVPATMQVYIDAEYAAFIEDVWVEAFTGVQYGTKSTPVLVPQAVHNVLNIAHDLWLVTIPVNPVNVNAHDNIDFVVHTKRNPFGGQVFTGTYTVPVIVDGKDYILDNTVITGISSTQNIVGMLSPKADATIVASFNDIGELIVDNGVDALPVAIADWFVLQNATPEAFVNIADPAIVINGNDVVATWTFDAADINDALAAGVNQLAFTLQYQNIWGHTRTSAPITFNFDQHAPVISNDGITFYQGDDIVQTDNYSAANYIANNLNWTKVRFAMNDPELRAGVAGSGIQNIAIALDREAETYTPNPDPLQNMTATYNVAGNYIELAFNAGFTAFDLAEGYYNFTIDTFDGLDNDAQYVQRLLYWHHPSQMEIVPQHLSTINVLKADGAINEFQITAFPNDPDGQVQAVQFFLYEDVDGDGVYNAAIDIDRTADLTNDSSNGAIDNLAPYTAMWNFDAPHYKYLVNAVYDRDASRQFLLRAAALSQGARAVTDSIVVINVVDNQAPVPNVPVIVGNQIFDYITTANNVLTITATIDPIWIDAEEASFTIKDDLNNVIETIDVLFVGGVATANWDYNGQEPGVFHVSVTATDFVGNTSAAVDAAPVSIQNPASLISYNMTMTDVQGFDDETLIPAGTIYGTNNPVAAVGDIRLDTQFFINDPLHPLNGQLSLEGVQALTFKARVTNNVTGAVTVIDLVNDIALQPDYPATGAIEVTPQIINNTVTLFIPDNFYMVAGYDAQDISYDFFVELTPIHPAVLQAPVYTGIRLDYYAPVIAITDATPNITWSQNNRFEITGDVADVDAITMWWSSDNSTWLAAQDANYQALPFQSVALPTPHILFENWNTAGGSLETLLDYEGAVWVKVNAVDALGNERESAPVQLFIDNVAPVTPVTHVAYRTHPDVEAGVPEGTYSSLHALGTLANEANNTINVVTSTQGNYGTSTLRIYVDPAQITNTSNVALGANNAWNNMASWYNGTSDFRPPVRLYHGFSATGDLNNITWTPGALYDHEPWDGLYGFDIPAATIANEGAHYFILASSDTRGNWEGNFADDTQAFDGVFGYDEMVAAIDLTVNVTNIADVQVEVVAPANNAIVGEWVNMAANVTNNVGGVAVNEVVFQRKVGAAWVDMATVANTATSDVHFHLYRKDIPAYDGLPNVPGVHLYVNNVNHGELIWNEATQSWSNTYELAQGNYNFEYFLDLNNDGIISNLDDNIAIALGGLNMRSIMDPNGFTNFTVTPWVYSMNTEEITDGLYEFRAVPIDANGAALFNYVSPSTWLHIDNTAPATTIESIGGVDRIRVALDPNNINVTYEQLKLAADVNELLVARDDIIEVTYQYSAQVPGATIRQWNDFASSTTMAGNYMVDFAVGLAGGIPSPLTDNIDNDADGLVDEADEAEAVYYLRAVSRDIAGNYFTSNVIEVVVDGNAPLMQVQNINGELMADTQNIFTIPTVGDVTITAGDITPANFDAPVQAYFEYIYRPTVNAPWSAPQPFDVNDIWQPVANGTASQILPAALVQEGYYGFRAIARDVLRNINIAAAPYTYVVFDDGDGSNAHIVSLGANPLDNNNPIPIISDEYAFAQSYTHFNGNINVVIDNPLEINTVTARWAETVNGPWTNINTVATNGAPSVMIPWTVPVLTRAPYIYLQVNAQDAFANTEASEIVKLYVDTTAPGAEVVAFTHTVEPVTNAKVLDHTENISITLSYTNLPEADLIDVKDVIVRVIKNDGSKQVLDNASFTIVNSPAHSTFEITAVAMAAANFDDGIYQLEIELVDFAGNASGIILPADYQMLYIDTEAPANLAIASTNYVDHVAPYDAVINFRVDYTDLIGLNDTAGALSATFSYQAMEQVVTEYTLDAANGWIDFSWDPSADFEQYITNGQMNINVSAVVKVTDLLGNEGIVPNTANFFTLTYGIPNTTKIMVVTDYAYNVNEDPNLPGDEYLDRVHMVNWNLPTPQVVATLGTDQSNPQPLDIYAYLAHQSDIPAYGVDFYWYDAVADVWNLIGSDAAGTQWPFVHPGFMDQNQREYMASWDIQGLPTGDYQIKTVSRHLAGDSESVVTLHIYNDHLVPNFSVNGAMNGQVERGETYTLALNDAAAFTGNADFAQGVVYMYRYVNPNNNNSPTSEWMHFGDNQGTFLTDWIQADYSFDWTVYPYYLYNNHVQIVAMALDQWGTTTPLAQVLPNSQYVHIVNQLAPAVSAAIVNWEATVLEDGVAHEAIVNATINTSSAPQDLVSVEFLYKLDTDAAFTSFDMQSGWTPAQMNNDLLVVSVPMNLLSDAIAVAGELKVVTTDVFGNTNEAVVNFNNLPTGTFVVTHDGEVLEGELERESTVVLDANPIAAEIAAVQYFWAATPVAPAAPVWVPLTALNAAPWTLEWDVPQNWTFGDAYMLKAMVTDAEGNSFGYARSFVITDHTTDIVIDTVAGIAPTSIGIIAPRLHGDNIPVQVTVNDPAIPRVEFMIRAADETEWTSVDFVNFVNNPMIYVFDDLTELASGEYYIGVRAAGRNIYPVIADQVLVTIDNDIAVTVNSFAPETNGYFDGNNFVVNFTVANEDEIDEAAVALEYNTAIEPIWMPAAIATLTTTNGIDYVATFANVNVPVDGFYNFRMRVQDSAIPMANFMELDLAQNVLVDTGAPFVNMVSINGQTDLTQAIDIELGTEAAITVSAYDITGGQIHLIASGINRVEFYNGAEMIGEVLAGVRSREVYTFVWNTLGFEINTSHQIHAVAYDNAGNNTATLVYNVNIVAPQQLEAYAMIVAMDFDYNTSNNDVLYAVVKDWPNTGATPAVTFEYFNGTAWNFFANGVDQGGYYSANFNAELMNGVTALRGVVNGNYNAPMPELAVSYNAVDHSLVTVDPAISANVFYLNELRVVESFQATPIVTALQGAAPVMNEPYMMNGNQVVDIAINAAGTHTFWAAVLDNNGNVQLTKAEVETVNAGTASDNGISFTVPAGGFGYFQNVAPAMPLIDGFNALSPQHAFFAKDNAGNLVNRDLTIAIAAPAAEGTLVAVWYDETTGTWSAPMAVTDNGNGTVSVAGVPSGHIVTVLQYTGVGINAMFSSIDPVHSVGANLWTTDAPMLQFFIYEGMDTNGYIIPAAVSSLDLYLDDVVVAPTAAFDPATGLVGYQAAGLSAGVHTIRVVVEQNGFTASAEQTFHVDTTEPVIIASGSQITSTNRAITATITDTETGILDAELTLGGVLVIPMSNLTVSGNTYTYNITDEDLFTLGYNFSQTMDLSASWTAENNLEMAVVNPVNVNYTVNIVGPGIVFTGFDNGWWINPTANTPLTFNVIAPAGREIQDNLMITLEELINDPVNGNYNNLIQQMQLTPVSVNGNVYSYSLNFGYSVAPNAHAIRLSVIAEDSYNVTTMSQQTYGIDYVAPIVWAVSPVGAPVNPGEFPVTYESAVIPYGTPVSIAVGFQDMQGFAIQETGEWVWVPADDTWHHDYLVYYTGASGINTNEVVVTLNGVALNGTVNGGAFTALQTGLAPGLHTVVATVADNAGNAGSLSYTFTVTGGAPSITFAGINGDPNNFWINSTNNNLLGFTVNTQGNVGIETVVANVYAEPSNMIIQGPITPTANGNDYSFTLVGGIVPAGQFGVRLEVIATSVLGLTSTSNQTYGIDNDAPQITLTSPAENSVFTQNALVNILATISDQIATKGGVLGEARSIRMEKAGSGLDHIELKVFNPMGVDLFADVTIPVAQVVAQNISGAQTAELGTYTIVMIAADQAGNQSMVTRTFMVAPTTGPTVDFMDYNNGWLIANQMNNLQFNVNGQGISSVTANVYANPSEAMLMGPLTVNPVNGVYTVGVNGNMIPADQNSIRLEVTVNDQFGNQVVANYYYNVDKIAPAITILNPAEGAEITRVNEATKVMIEAQFADLMPGTKTKSGSGIASSRLVVIGPDGMQIGAAVETGAGITETSHELTDLALGNYIARVTVIDKAGNQAMASVNFSVVEPPAPPVALDITSASIYPNPSDADTGARFSVSVNNRSTVSVRIYDFAGREVRTMHHAAKADGKSTIEIVFDGRNNDGVKLARGSYFARVIANDGMKTVEKVVKIAIRK